MKKIVSIILVIFYSLGVAYATPSEDNETWDNDVDYVICCYVRAYCNASCEEGRKANDVKHYKENIENKLDSVRDRKAHIPYNELSELLKNNEWSKTDTKLASVIDKRRNEKDYAKLIKISNLEDRYKKNLIAEQERLFELYLKKNQGNLKNKEEELDSAKKELKEIKEINENISTVNPFKILFFLVLAIFLFFCFGIYKRIKNEKEHCKSECEKLKDLKFENEKLKQSLDEKTREVAISKKEKNKLSKELNPASKTNEKPHEDTNSKEEKNKSSKELNPASKTNEKTSEVTNSKEEKRNPSPANPSLPNENIKYFQYPGSNGEVVLFDNESPNFYYKVNLESNTKGRFEFCGNSERAICNSDSYLANACEYKDIPVNTSSIITDELGILVLQGNVWRVEKKSQIHFS